MRCLAIWLALLSFGCDCGSPPPSTAAAPPPSSAAPPTSVAPPSSVVARVDAAVPAPSVEDQHAFRDRLRAARDAAHSGDYAAAYALFDALLHDHPEQTRVRCEAGFVAFRADRLDDAEGLVRAAVESWPSPPPARDRVPFAMCLYNRGLIAEARGDHATAADAWTRSIALRPNATVSSHLAALGAASAPPTTEIDGELPATTIEQALARLSAQNGGATPDVERVESAGPPALVAVHAQFDYDDQDVGTEEIADVVLVAGNDTVITLEPATQYEVWHSWYDDHFGVGTPVFYEGTPALGRLLAVQISSSGRSDDGSSSDDMLYVCAERADWECRDVSLSSVTTTCTDESETDCTDTGYELDWSLDGGALFLSASEGSELGTLGAPETGVIDLGRELLSP